MSAVQVRLATREDVDPLTDLVVAFRDHLSAEDPSESSVRSFLPHLLDDPSTELALALAPHGRALGYASCRFFESLWALGREAHVEDLFVVEQARRDGVGRALLAFVTERARRRGCRAIGLHTNERNEPAQAFYRRMGFAPASEPVWQGGRELFWVCRLAGAEGPK